MMYEQTYYKSMQPGEVYRCPPGGMIVLVVDNQIYVDSDRNEGYVTFFVIEAEGNVNWTRGEVVRVEYGGWKCGSWTRVS